MKVKVYIDTSVLLVSSLQSEATARARERAATCNAIVDILPHVQR